MSYRDTLMDLVPELAPKYGTQWEVKCPYVDCPCQKHKHAYLNEVNGRGRCFRCNTPFSIEFFLHREVGLSYDYAKGIVKGFDKLSRIDKVLASLRRDEENTHKDLDLDKVVSIPQGCELALGCSYLHKRGIDDSLVRDFDISLCREGYYKDRVVIPVYRNNGLKGFVARSTIASTNATSKQQRAERIKKVLYSKGFNSSKNLFNIDSVDSSYVILVEGVFDAFSVYPIDKNVVAIFGTHLSSYQIRLLLERGVKEAYVFLDRDAKYSTPCISLTKAGIQAYVTSCKRGFKDPGEMDYTSVLTSLGESRKWERRTFGLRL